MKRTVLYLAGALLLVLSACRKEKITPDTPPQPTPPEKAEIAGFYLLNQGNWGANKASLDYYDFATGNYTRDVYETRNPEVPTGLGDVGQDLQIYGSKLYAVINASNKVEVMDVATTRRIGQVEIPNARYICFEGGKAYVSAYLSTKPGEKGAVFEIDTATLAITHQFEVGLQPEMLSVVGGTLYVANSGGYNQPEYDKTISVLPLTTKTPSASIPVAINLEMLRIDRHQQIWVTSRGNYNDIPSNLYCLAKNATTGQYEVVKDMKLPCSRFDIRGDSLFYYHSFTDYEKHQTTNSFGVVDVKKREALTHSFLTDAAELVQPYNLVLQPNGGNIYIADATDFKSSGFLYCYSYDGKFKWKVQTGDIPCAIAFVKK